MDLLVPRSRQLKIQIYVVHLGDTQTGAVFFLEVSVNLSALVNTGEKVTFGALPHMSGYKLS